MRFLHMSWSIFDEVSSTATDQQVVLSCMHISHLEHSLRVSPAAVTAAMRGFDLNWLH